MILFASGLAVVGGFEIRLGLRVREMQISFGCNFVIAVALRQTIEEV